MTVLILGGTSEAAALDQLLAEQAPEIRAVISLAGHTSDPRPLSLPTRTGGFGGISGLRQYLVDEGVVAVIDATHPFAAIMPYHAEAACKAEGVPGPDGHTGASADIAALLGWPVVLVVDVSGQAQSAGAVALGCMAYDKRIHVAGVILNKVASERHRRLAAAGMERIGLPVFGALPREASLILPERHLGLVQAGEIDPDQIHTPGIFVKRIVHVADPVKRIEQRTTRKRSA